MSKYTLILVCAYWLFQAGLSNAQSPVDLKATHQILLAEAFQLTSEIQDSVWSGWSDAPSSLLLITSDYEYLIDHPSPSDDFRNIGYYSLLKDSVYVRQRQFPPNLRATFPAVGGIPIIVIGTPDSTESPTEWILTVQHEHFHQWQMSRPNYYSAVDSLGLSGGDDSGQWMLNYPFPYDSTAVKNSFNKLTRNLKSTLQAIGNSDFESNLESYLHSRNSFREILNTDDYRYFSFQLWQEGVARYIEYRTAKLASQYFNPSEKFKLFDGYKSFGKISDDQSDHIMQRLTNLSLEEDKRVAFYPIGAAEALLLDQINPDWHKFYWKEKFYLERHFKKN